MLSSARSCLEHRHAYVRKNAVFAISSIHTHSPSLIPDASELISTFLEGESDGVCRRNGFAALASIDHDAALLYLGSVFEGIPNAEELLQLVELEFIRKDAVQNSQNKVGSSLLAWRIYRLLTQSLGSISKTHFRPARSRCLNRCIRSRLVPHCSYQQPRRC